MTPGEKAISEMRKALEILSSNKYCIFGCSQMKQEGCRSYTENSPTDKNGICIKCNRKRLGELTEDEKTIKNIIE